MLNRRGIVFALELAVLSNIAGCVLPPLKEDEYEAAPYSDKEFVQVKDSIKVEMQDGPLFVSGAKGTPSVFLRTAIKCDANGIPTQGSDPVATSPNGKTARINLFAAPAATEEVNILRDGMWIQKVTLTNSTSHVLRMNSAVIKLFDPSGNQFSPIGYDELRANLLAARPCPTSNGVALTVSQIPMFTKNVEIIPKTSFSGYLVFDPHTAVSGVWKLGMYEIPTTTDKAGQVTATTQFEIRSSLKHFVATYSEELGKPKQLVTRVEAN